MAFNNTYNIQAINESAFDATISAVPKCLELAKQCREAVGAEDPNNTGTNSLVSKTCAQATQECLHIVAGDDTLPGRDVFDIAQSFTSSFPPKWAAGWLNSGENQRALGVPLNFTGLSVSVSEGELFTFFTGWRLTCHLAFGITGDFGRPGNLENLGKLLDRGVKVSLIYGDRDWQCNCKFASFVFFPYQFLTIKGSVVKTSRSTSHPPKHLLSEMLVIHKCNQTRTAHPTTWKPTSANLALYRLPVSSMPATKSPFTNLN